jgi:cytochrome c-type biogenesis protein CcmE
MAAGWPVGGANYRDATPPWSNGRAECGRTANAAWYNRRKVDRKAGEPLSKKLRIKIGAVMILAALVYLGLQATKSYSQYFVPVSQYEAHLARFQGQIIRVQGKLLARSVHYNPSTEVLTFLLASGGRTMAVRYVGALPTEEFKDAHAIVEGQMGKGGVFNAEKLMVQCPNHIVAIKTS